MDEKTPRGHLEDLSVYGDDGTSQAAAKEGHIYMDAMGFGMGLACLQVTFQCCNIDEAKMLYDKLAPICPILLALTASSPMFRGFLADVDCRWDIISASVDDRTREERSFIPKSRYDSISSFISNCATTFEYNDVPVAYDVETYERLKSTGFDELMAKHISQLFVR
jgi:glutamate--cysteine ligase catalytic subunit